MASHADVAHNWAHKTGTKQNGGNVFYEGDTIYSYGYHFPMARHVHVKGQDIVLFTTENYSVSTSKHLTHTWRACYHMNPISVADVKAERKQDHLLNMKEGFARVAVAMGKADRARKYKDEHIAGAQRVMDQLQRYAKLFLPRHKFNFDLGVAQEEIKKSEARERKRAVAEKKRKAKAEAKRLKEWMAGENNYLYFYNSPCKLRSRMRPADTFDRENPTKLEHIIETSHGARVPYEAGERAFRFAIARRQKGWKRNGEKFEVGSYQLDAINKTGVVAGCHRIAWDEIERFAKQEGWTK